MTITDSPEPVAPGTRLGHFVILSRIGTGGMGEVYEAEDTRLHRHVAIKVVRQELAADSVRRARLEREAAAVAKLNHPNIVTVYSLDTQDGVLFIAMERIEGSTLDAILPERGFPLERLMPLAVQLADALSAAHGVGIVHRDLKPSNIMITRDGTLKVLDFGLSRLAIEPDQAKTTVQTLSVDGSLMGTVPYMSPEQVEGEIADARSDLFSLGIVLFEAATGQRPFSGRTALATLTSIVKDPTPDVTVINPDVPEELARVIERCLIKDPGQRTQSALDLKRELEDLSRAFESARWRPGSHRRYHAPVRGRISWRWAVAAAALAGVAVVTALWLAFARGPADVADARVTRFVVDVPKGGVVVPEFNPHIALSRDGTQLAFTPLPGSVSIRRLDALDSRPLSGSETPGFRDAPLFSPDGSSLSFIYGNAIFSPSRPFYAAALSGGAPTKLAEYDAFYRGDWSEDGWIYWTAAYAGGLVRIPQRGGDIQPVTSLDLAHGERSHRFARLLPGDQALIYTVGFDGLTSYDDARIDLWDLRSQTRKTLITGGTSAAYSPSGHLVFARGGKLIAVPFDLSRREVTGAPFEVLDGVMMSGTTGAAEFSLSRRGDLAYVPGRGVGRRRTLVWVDREGRATPLPLPPASYLYPRLSPDGRFLAVEIEGPNHDLYIYDFGRGVLTKVTTDGLSHDPVWTPDGRQLAFRSWSAGGMTMWLMPADRSAKPVRLAPDGTRQSPVSISSDGKFLAFDQKDPETRDDAWVLPLAGGQARAVARSRFDEGSAKFSPDGRWIAYASDESGDGQVYVQPFPGPGPKIQVSNAGGFDPVWRRAGGELYYRSSKGMMAVSITTSPGLKVSAPRPLWQGAYSDGVASSCGMPGVSSSNYDVTADGTRFLMVRDDDAEVAATRVVVVLNWADELKRLAAAQPATRVARVN